MRIYSSLTDRLKTQHQAIENIISITDPGRITRRPKPDKWNIHDNVAHLTRYQRIFQNRIDQILNNDKPLIGRYKAEEDPEFGTFRSMKMEELLRQLDADRKIIYDLITKLNEVQLGKIGVHGKFGPLNILQWTEFFLLHEAHHIYTIFQLANDIELIYS